MSRSRTADRDTGSGAGFTVSALLHGTLIALTVIAWPKLVPPIEFEPDTLPVDVLDVSEMTNIMAQTKAEEPPPEPVVEPTPPPPAPETMAMNEPPPPPPPEDIEAEAPALAPPETKPTPPTPHVAPTIRPRAKPRPEKPKEEFDINRIAALTNKIAKDQPKAAPPAEPAPATASRTIQGVGAQTAMTMSEIDALRTQMMKCWNVPVGAPDPTALVLRVKVDLNQDGSVAGAPQLLDTMNMTDPYFRAAAESAIRAVNMCAPYKLPVEKYDAWREVNVTFDPRKMAGF